MAKHLFRTKYTKAELEGLLREGGTGRREALRQTIDEAVKKERVLSSSGSLNPAPGPDGAGASSPVRLALPE